MPRVLSIGSLVVQIALALGATSGVRADPAGNMVADQRRPKQKGAPFDGTARRLAVAWNDSINGSGVVRAMSTHSPWEFQTLPLETDPDSVLRSAGGRVYVVSRAQGTVAVVARDTWTMLQVYPLGEGSEPQDIAVVSAELAYVTRRSATHLLRLELDTGASTEVVDLSLFADGDGVPDMGMMAVHEGRLFVQIRRVNLSEPGGFVLPAYLAVVDTATEQLVDVDPATPGVQAVELQGTAPKGKMQIIPQTRRLFVSASGDFWDEGGIEMIDLDTLQSVGMAVREADGQVGADLGAFVMVSPERGYLVFSTDLLLSSHLVPFTKSGGVEPGPELHFSLGYFAPTLVYDPETDTFFFPEGGFDGYGVHVFDAFTGTRLTPEPLATSGQPTDLVLLSDFDCDGDGDVDLDDFTDFAACFEGPGAGLPEVDCTCFDSDADADIDLGDFVEFQVAFTG